MCSKFEFNTHCSVHYNFNVFHFIYREKKDNNRKKKKVYCNIKYTHTGVKNNFIFLKKNFFFEGKEILVLE